MIEVDEFRTIEEATTHHDFLKSQIDKLGNFILEKFPNMDGEYYSYGACGAAIFIIMDFMNDRDVGKFSLPDEYRKSPYLVDDDAKCEQ